jgi:hypothetical protein
VAALSVFCFSRPPSLAPSRATLVVDALRPSHQSKWECQSPDTTSAIRKMLGVNAK